MSSIGIAVVAVTGLIAAHYIGKLWPEHGKWGMNPNPVNCPRCNLKMSAVRKPANMRQVLWGGWTCSECGCEMDKYGKPVDSASA